MIASSKVGANAADCEVRTFVDFLAEKFGPEPYWDAWRNSAAPAGKGGQRAAARRKVAS
jgi:hypothetical protein